ncbi:MAG: nickel-dependent lactate racemase [candidate division WOR-3 bacterium]
MEIKFSLGSHEVSLEVPQENLLGVLKLPDNIIPKEIESEDILEKLHSFLGNSKKVLVIVNDYTRPTPTEKIIELIDILLKNLDVRFIVACGSHLPPNTSQLYQIFGKYAQIYKDRIISHNAQEITRLKFLGKTRFGTPVWLNQMLWEAEKIIVINSVEPHYFAGYTGGRKSFIPGVAGLETITINHKLSLSPNARTLNLKDNPVHEDMTEAAKMIPRPIFSLQAVIDVKHRLFSLRYGDIFKSFEDAIYDANEVFCAFINEKADIVICLVQPPYDINFYQSQKAMENGKLALKKGGILIVASECREGVGDESFIKIFEGAKDPQEVLKKTEENFVLGGQKSAKLAELLMNAEVWAVTPIDDSIIRKVFMRPFRSLKDALSEALKIKGPRAKVYILPDASLTVPMIN